MMRYSQVCPVIFGEGAAKELGAEAKGLGITKAIVVTDEIIAGGDGYRTCIESLKAAGIAVAEFTKCQADPPSDVVHEASRMAKAEKVDGVVGIGGGSSLDTAKGVNLLFNNPEPITQYFNMTPQTPGYPLICVPTAAGTGSEVTVLGVLTNSQTGVKGPAIYSPATLAILDPAMTVSAPPSITAMTAMDALAHAAEAMTSRTENPKADVLAVDAIKRIFRSLPKAYDDGGDMEARADVLLGSNFAGIAFGDAMVHLGHAIAHSICVRFHYPHGLGCALALPEAMRFAAVSKPDKVKRIGEAMGLTFGESDANDQIGDQVADAVFALMKRVKIPSLKELGVSRDDHLGIIDLVTSDICFQFLPSPLTKDEALGYLASVYDKY